MRFSIQSSEWKRLVVRYSSSAFLVCGLMSCETLIQPDLERAPQVLVVDAWVTIRHDAQEISIKRTAGYFDNAGLPGVEDASVVVRNVTTGRDFMFMHLADGVYRWIPPTDADSLGVVGDSFALSVVTSTGSYTAESRAGRVPVIDSVYFFREPASGLIPESTFAEFWAIDPPGSGDTYWIKAWKNDTLLLRPSEINLAYDAGFSEGGNYDGGPFITPKRRGISPVVTDEEGNFLSPFRTGDSVYVEIHSITRGAFEFMNQVFIQTDRPGGFQELFASPPANVSTNIKASGAAAAIGFFNVAHVSSNGRRLVN